MMSQAEIGEKSANIEQAPCIFQNILTSFELELRLLETIFPIKVNSQINKATQFDWRKDQLNTEHKLFKLPKETERNYKTS